MPKDKIFKAFNARATPDKLEIRYQSLDGVNYLIAPVVLVREQVLNGEYLPADEISKSAISWNGRPVVVHHPTTPDGTPVIANSPDVVEDYEVGKLYNISYDPESTKLKGEIWVDAKKARKKNNYTRQALDMILNSDKLQVSTGYVVSTYVPATGEFDGVQYTAIQRNILPDHLALLPDEEGACNWEDGAGVRNNSKNMTDLQNLLFNALESKGEKPCYINSIQYDADDDALYAVYETRSDDGMQYSSKRIQFEISSNAKGMVVLKGIPEKVFRQDAYVTASDLNLNNAQKPEYKKRLNDRMNKVNFVRSLINNSHGKFSSKDYNTLMKMNDSQLQALANKPIETVKTQTQAISIKANGSDVTLEQLVSMNSEDAVAVINSVEDASTLEAAASMIDNFLVTTDAILTAIDAKINSLNGDGTADNMDTSAMDFQEGEITDEDDTVTAISHNAKQDPSKKSFRKTAPKATKACEKQTLNSYIEGIDDPDVKSALKALVSESKNKRNSLIQSLAANATLGMSAKELSALETNVLEKMHAAMSANAKPSTNTADWSIRNNAQDEQKPTGYTPLSNNIFGKRS